MLPLNRAWYKNKALVDVMLSNGLIEIRFAPFPGIAWNRPDSQKVYTFTIALTGCGSVVNNTLKSPRFPKDYPNDMDCNYTVPIPSGMFMTIKFKYFKLEDPDNQGSCR